MGVPSHLVPTMALWQEFVEKGQSVDAALFALDQLGLEGSVYPQKRLLLCSFSS